MGEFTLPRLDRMHCLCGFSIAQRSMRGSEWVAAMYCLSVVLVLMLRLAWMCAGGESWSIQGCTSSSLGKSLLRTRFSMRQRSMRYRDWVAAMYCFFVVLILRVVWMRRM